MSGDLEQECRAFLDFLARCLSRYVTVVRCTHAASSGARSPSFSAWLALDRSLERQIVHTQLIKLAIVSLHGPLWIKHSYVPAVLATVLAKHLRQQQSNLREKNTQKTMSESFEFTIIGERADQQQYRPSGSIHIDSLLQYAAIREIDHPHRKFILAVEGD